MIFNVPPITLIKTLTECRSPIQNASFDTFKAKIGYLFTTQSTLESPLE